MRHPILFKNSLKCYHLCDKRQKNYLKRCVVEVLKISWKPDNGSQIISIAYLMISIIWIDVKLLIFEVFNRIN